ncbi:PREDICTED: uncharacterized protein LOC109468276 [Branchiostoma belcheri]|uniref:Uncharacterized protein LOC109468276 n=1 Tax=Branchiostoma belcheri TaxID=7741 RepID=A0A6P4YXU1_BRABE|nr:PREDICTED: uncharacterized protein LOC109468276 [Branchiostoma belcheri]
MSPRLAYLDMGDNEKKQVVGRYEESDRRFEDVDPAGYSIFALGSGLQRTAPNGPPPRHLDMKDNEKDEVGIRNEESDRMYEDVDPAGESIFTLGSGLQPAAPNEPKYVDMEGKKKKKVDRRNEKSDRKYEDVDPAGESIFEETGEMGEDMSGGVDVIINSGLKRPVPDLPPPRNSDAGDRMAEDKRSEEPCSDPCNEQVDNAGHNAGDATPSHKLDMGDHIVMFPEQKDDPYSDPYYKPQETDANEKHEEKRFSIKERIMGMWNKAKSSKICWVLLGCGVLVIVSVVTAVVLSAYIQPGSKQK